MKFLNPDKDVFYSCLDSRLRGNDGILVTGLWLLVSGMLVVAERRSRTQSGDTGMLVVAERRSRATVRGYWIPACAGKTGEEATEYPPAIGYSAFVGMTSLIIVDCSLLIVHCSLFIVHWPLGYSAGAGMTGEEATEYPPAIGYPPFV
ncbi:hypothetical protein ACFL6N_04695 [Thermodesulfobacteriota bacterium]